MFVANYSTSKELKVRIFLRGSSVDTSYQAKSNQRFPDILILVVLKHWFDYINK